MLQQPKPGWKPIFRDLEKIHSALEFAELVYDDASRLASDLLTGENIHCSHLHDVARCIAHEVECQPFYIQHIVAGLRLKQISVTPDTIRHHVRQQLVDASDPWLLAHYRKRLHSYYPRGHYLFRSQLIRRWWKLDQAL